MSEQKKINIRNKRATFDYEILEEYVAGVVLVGTEIKSIRAGRASLTDSFCYFERRALVADIYIFLFTHILGNGTIIAHLFAGVGIGQGN